MHGQLDIGLHGTWLPAHNSSKHDARSFGDANVNLGFAE
jgi:hypothetical protein